MTWLIPDCPRCGDTDIFQRALESGEFWYCLACGSSFTHERRRKPRDRGKKAS